MSGGWITRFRRKAGGRRPKLTGRMSVSAPLSLRGSLPEALAPRNSGPFPCKNMKKEIPSYENITNKAPYPYSRKEASW